MGYHIRQIAKGELGQTSKIREELEELEDAEDQNNRIMALAEMADLYGALEACVIRYGLTMQDLHTMNEATKRAFQTGRRT